VTALWRKRSDFLTNFFIYGQLPLKKRRRGGEAERRRGGESCCSSPETLARSRGPENWQRQERKKCTTPPGCPRNRRRGGTRRIPSNKKNTPLNPPVRLQRREMESSSLEYKCDLNLSSYSELREDTPGALNN